MIKVVAKNYVKKENIAEFNEVAKMLVAKTRENDEGCISYGLFQEIGNPAVLTIFEEWENKEYLDKHMESRHFKELAPRIGELCEKPGEISLYTDVR